MQFAEVLIVHFFPETLRKYPASPIVFRMPVNDYKLPDSNMIIPKNTQILIPTYAIHHDPDIYENPDEFNPDRFKDDQVMERHSNSYMPFGDGPRGCIAVRFAMMQMRIT